MTISEIRQLIAKGHTKQAAEALLGFYSENSRQTQEILALQGQLSELLRQERIGYITFEEKNRTMNRIRMALLSYCDEQQESAETLADLPAVSGLAPAFEATQAKLQKLLDDNLFLLSDEMVYEIQAEIDRIKAYIKEKIDQPNYDLRGAIWNNIWKASQKLAYRIEEEQHFDPIEQKQKILSEIMAFRDVKGETKKKAFLKGLAESVYSLYPDIDEREAAKAAKSEYEIRAVIQRLYDLVRFQ